MRTKQVNLLEGNIVRALLAFSLPLLISNIFQQLYNTVDTIIVGHYLGDVSLAAIGASAPIYTLLVGFTLGVGTGMNIVIGRIFGSGDREKLKQSVAATIVIGTAISLGLLLAAFFWIEPLLILLETPHEIRQETMQYIDVIVIFGGVTLAFNICSGVLRAVGNSTTPLFFLIFSSVLNIILDLLFVSTFQMGVRGAAIATVVSQALSTLLSILYILRRSRFLVPARMHFRIDGQLYRDMLGQGLSIGLMHSLVSLGSLIMQYAVNQMGYLIIAGQMAAKKLFFFAVMPITSLASALSTFVAQNKGADRPLRIRSALRHTMLLSSAYSVLISILIYFVAPALMRLLTGSTESEVIDFGTRFIRIEAPFFLVLGPLFHLRYTLQGIGQKILPLISSIIELFGKILFTFYIIPRTGQLGIILSEPVIWCFMALQLAWAYYRDPYIRASKLERS